MEEEQFNNIYEKEETMKKSIYFLLFLFGIGIILYLLLTYCKKYSIIIYKLKNIFIFNFLYIIFFGFISTFMIYYGYKYLLTTLQYYIQDDNIDYLIITSFMILVTLIYSALLKNIIEVLFQHKVQINEWYNVLGYPIGRTIGILILYFIIIQVGFNSRIKSNIHYS